MKKPVLIRFVALVALYYVMFAALITIQFPQDAARAVAVSGTRRAAPENPYFNPSAFVIPEAREADRYDALLAEWRDTHFAVWEARVAAENAASDDTVLAYLAESLMRDSPVAPLLPDGYERSDTAAVFLGQLDQGLRFLDHQAERAEERLLMLASLSGNAVLVELQHADTVDMRPAAFLEYLADRGSIAQLTGMARGIRAVAPSAVSWETMPEIFAGYAVWERCLPDGENPFAHLVDPAYRLLSVGLTLHPDGKRVFVCYENSADIAFNLCLARALIAFSDHHEQNRELAALGRSLILSSLSLHDENGTLPARIFFDFSENGMVQEDADRFESAWGYNLLGLGTYFPHAAHLGGSAWVWTGAPVVAPAPNHANAALFPQAPLDIAVAFPQGQTHYLVVRGFPRPASVALHGAELPASANVEPEAASGWSYSPSTQSILLKLTHREAVEHIVIGY
ncbi:MAG: hypothetical protein LBS86_01000 [Treponema sp.]|jgi:hypothetical protein|nr:hypothetical protein [Treponema sp.]